ncbi:DUF3631 domain-containing protein [Nitrosomonas oligotropha]|uniref:Putative DNA primase/helicase n=1 Tax=Nitrosomonas oligotropha TaxID=42354 RepID=A0A1H8TY06_9PROT|nr:DUF3631 domain-containing protein [Nitrosomonas oligotropha]SDX38197.1 putative DNA primase/helicase [Nitrosomonas oligotropha]SEO95912.1 putative DNA primase/helicase [Nitrosomonas oligotropha]
MSDLEQQATELLESVTKKETDKEALKRLAAMSILDYNRTRDEEAKNLGVIVSALDRAVNECRKKTRETTEGLPDVEPWPHPANPDELLTSISSTVSRFIVCDKETADTAALWVCMTWLMDVVHIAPLAVITAPEKRCGKTQLLTILGNLSYRPLSASNISTAALYRCIEAWNPTLLLDETDAFMKENEELRCVINSGHSRDNAYVIRTVGDEHTPKRFSTWGAKALSGIGHLSDTLMDRSIVLELRRKLGHENVDRLRYAEPGLFLTLSRKLARFADDCREQVRRARPMLPDALNDRAQDNWEPLFAIAECASNGWIEKATKAALKLSGNDKTDSIGNELLADIQEVFETKNVTKISTANLIAALLGDEEKSWATYNRGKPLSPKQLGNKLKGYDIRSKTIRFGFETAKGYELDQFTDAFDRYLSYTLPLLSVTLSQTNSGNGLSDSDNESVTVTDPSKRNNATHSAKIVRI